MKRLGCVVVVLLMVGIVAPRAHDISVFPTLAGSNLQLTLKFGHPGDYSAAAPGKLIVLDAYPPTGEKRPLAGRVRPDGDLLVMTPLEIDVNQPGTWVIAAFYDNGFTLRTADGRWVNTTKAEYPTAETSTHNVKYGKALLQMGASGKGYDTVAGHRIELIPRVDPFTVKPGGTLDLEVRFEGKPLAQATVRAYVDETTTKTVERTSNAAGMVQMPIARGGRHILSVEHNIPSRHPEMATRDAYAASLIFSLAESRDSR